MLFILTLSSLTTLKAQPPGCPWTVNNGLNCSLTVTIVKYCGTPLTVGSGISRPGSWTTPSVTSVTINDADMCGVWPNCNLPGGCTVKISLDGGATYLSDGQSYCCPTCGGCRCNPSLPVSPTNCCYPNGCVKIVIDCINHIISFIKPPGC